MAEKNIKSPLHEVAKKIGSILTSSVSALSTTSSSLSNNIIQEEIISEDRYKEGKVIGGVYISAQALRQIMKHARILVSYGVQIVDVEPGEIPEITDWRGTGKKSAINANKFKS